MRTSTFSGSLELDLSIHYSELPGPTFPLTPLTVANGTQIMHIHRKLKQSQVQWLTTVIPATQEVEIRRFIV
jgi:hypothetical protein